MTEKQVEEGNKLIAEFMDWKLYGSGTSMWYETGDESIDSPLISELKFHKDWNWLMSVVDKIESGGQILLFDELGNDRCRVVKFHSRPYYGFGSEKFTDTKIQAVFQAVIEVIERINENRLEQQNGMGKN